MFGFKRSLFRHRRMAFLLSLIASPLVSAANLGLDGAWFNPAQSGHGLTLAQATDTTMVGIWHTYDAAGNALTLYADLTLEGDVLSGTAYAPKGMRFGSFNPNDLQLPVWGEISLKVGDQCKNLELKWQSALPIYGNGETSLVRLAGGANQACAVQSGDYQLLSGTYTRDNEPSASAMVFGAIDANGKLWVFQSISGLAVHVVRPGATLIAERDPSASSHWIGSLAATRANEGSATINGNSTFDADGNESIRFTKTYSSDFWTYGSWLLQPSTDEPLPLRTINDLAGEYVSPVLGQFVPGILLPMSIDASGHICINPNRVSGECGWSGQAAISSTDGMFDFTVGDAHSSAIVVGRGWKQTAIEPRTGETDNVLLMVGRDQNGNGFGLGAY
ncbi:MAG: hypothetical protein J0L65_08420 [Xanthomonadales bacterium]|jgi:hypothetical protein|nr:hypothetical protein [Xanthomonadales bacterium]